MHEKKENPGKFPGGRAQAIAIGYSQARRGKSVDVSDEEDGMEKTKKAIEILKSNKIDRLVNYEIREHGKVPTPEEEEEEKRPGAMTGTVGVKKALTSQSYPQRRQVPAYDPTESFRAGSAIPVTPAYVNDTSIMPPPGQRAFEVFKSCAVHGIVYPIDRGCSPCTVEKSLMCKTCNTEMRKYAGGTYHCPDHG